MPELTNERIKNWRCDACRQKSLRRVKRPYEYDISHDGRPPVRIVIPDLDVIACTNPECDRNDPEHTVILDAAATERIGDETNRQLGLLTPAEIRENRGRLGLNQQELQELLGLGGNSLSRWENGRVYQSRSMDTLLRLVFKSPEALTVLKSLRSEALPHEPAVA